MSIAYICPFSAGPLHPVRRASANSSGSSVFIADIISPPPFLAPFFAFLMAVGGVSDRGPALAALRKTWLAALPDLNVSCNTRLHGLFAFSNPMLILATLESLMTQTQAIHPEKIQPERPQNRKLGKLLFFVGLDAPWSDCLYQPYSVFVAVEYSQTIQMSSIAFAAAAKSSDLTFRVHSPKAISNDFC